MDATALLVGLVAASVGLLSPILTYRYMRLVERDRWVRERRADAYIRIMAMCLLVCQQLEYLPDDVGDVGEYLRAQSPFRDPDGQEAGMAIIAFGSPDMIGLMRRYTTITHQLIRPAMTGEQIPPLLLDLQEIHQDMSTAAVREIQGVRQAARHRRAIARRSRTGDVSQLDTGDPPDSSISKGVTVDDHAR